MTAGDFCLRVVGVTYPNSDGSSRQTEISRCVAGERIELWRERSNPFDPSAVAVISARDVQVGYIGADRCGWIGSKIDRGLPIHVVVDRIVGTESDRWLGMVIRLNMGGDMPAFDPDEGYAEILRRYA